MVKSKKQQQTKKACFGTKEWSKNSGICNRCILKDQCGNIEETRRVKNS